MFKGSRMIDRLSIAEIHCNTIHRDKNFNYVMVLSPPYVSFPLSYLKIYELKVLS